MDNYQLHHSLQHVLEGQNIIKEKLTFLDSQISLLNNKIDNLTHIIVDVNDDVNLLKGEAKLIAAWQDAKKRNNMNQPETWCELTKALHQYFADQLNHSDNAVIN